MAPATPSEWDHKIGVGNYPNFSARWHFDLLGLPLDRIYDLWTEAATRAATHGPTRIALIDTDVARNHPNLQDGAINDSLSLDIGNHPASIAQANPRRRVSLADYLTAIETPDPDPDMGPVNAALSSSHGTCMAGLMSGRPSIHALLEVTQTQLSKDNPEPDLRARCMPLPFSGMDPTSEIMALSMSSEPSIEQVHAALAAAKRGKADLIVLATDLQRPEGSSFAEWKDLSDAFVALSMDIPIICAAGNLPGADDPNVVAYPAILSDDTNGIFAVGALNSRCERTSYTPYSPVITMHGPSSDGERHDAVLRRLDRNRWGFGEGAENVFAGDPAHDPLAPSEVLPVERIVSTDIPGRYGRNPSSFEDLTYVAPPEDPLAPSGQYDHDLYECLLEHDDPADLNIYYDFSSNYCLFGGTSAAAAICGGVVALAISTGVFKSSDARALKAHLAASADPDNPQLLTYDVLADLT